MNIVQKFFLNLENIRAHQNKIRAHHKEEIPDQKEVQNELFDFYNNFFKSDRGSPKQWHCSVFELNSNIVFYLVQWACTWGWVKNTIYC